MIEIVDYTCTFCGKRKGSATDWLMGFEVISKTMKVAVTFLKTWDDTRAEEPNAIRFCSRTCQTKYLEKNYGDETWAT